MNDASNLIPVPSIQADLELDTSGLTCPLPILRAKKSLAQLAPGQVLKILTTDPNAYQDFQVFAKQTGHQLLAQQKQEAGWVHFLQRKR